MLIGDKWKVESDEMCITLFDKKVAGEKSKKPGEPFWEAYGYYPNMEQLYRGLLNLNILRTELKDLETILNAINDVKKLILEVTKNESL